MRPSSNGVWSFRSSERRRQGRQQSEKNNNNNKDFTIQFDSKRRTSREEAITSLVDTLSSKPRRKFTDENCITLCNRCLARLTSKKIGSSNYSKTEIRLSVRVISLLFINLVDEEKSYEVFDECVPILANALVSFEAGVDDDDVVLELLVCLGMVGFFGSRGSTEIEKVMVVVWEFVNRLSNLDSLVLASGITSWLLLLTRMQGQHLSNKNWKGSMSYFSILLFELERKKDSKDGDYCESLYQAVMDALTLIFKIDKLNKFSDEGDEVEGEKDYNSLKDELMGKVNRNLDDFSESVQIKIMKKFLGPSGFGTHLRENENFHGWFESMSCYKSNEGCNDDQAPEREEVKMKFYRPENERQVKDDNDDLLPYVSGTQKNIQKRMVKSPSSFFSKARTQLLNKQRNVATHVPTDSEVN